MDCIDLFKKAAAALQTDPAIWSWTLPAVRMTLTRSCSR